MREFKKKRKNSKEINIQIGIGEPDPSPICNSKHAGWVSIQKLIRLYQIHTHHICQIWSFEIINRMSHCNIYWTIKHFLQIKSPKIKNATRKNITKLIFQVHILNWQILSPPNIWKTISFQPNINFNFQMKNSSSFYTTI